MRGAHVEHAVHVRDAGRVEAQRLVERRRGLPSRKEGMRCGARCGAGLRGRQGVGRGRRKQRAEGRGSVQNLGRQGRRGAHPEHVEHVRDAGRVEAQRLVESRGALPSRKEGMRRGARRRAGRRHGAAAAQAARARGRLRLKAGGQGTRGAHVKHGGHVRDAERVEAQRLVESRSALPSRKQGYATRGEVARAGRRHGAAAAQEACARGRLD